MLQQKTLSIGHRCLLLAGVIHCDAGEAVKVSSIQPRILFASVPCNVGFADRACQLLFAEGVYVRFGLAGGGCEAVDLLVIEFWIENPDAVVDGFAKIFAPFGCEFQSFVEEFGFVVGFVSGDSDHFCSFTGGDRKFVISNAGISGGESRREEFDKGQPPGRSVGKRYHRLIKPWPQVADVEAVFGFVTVCRREIAVHLDRSYAVVNQNRLNALRNDENLKMDRFIDLEARDIFGFFADRIRSYNDRTLAGRNILSKRGADDRALPNYRRRCAVAAIRQSQLRPIIEVEERAFGKVWIWAKIDEHRG